MWLEGAFPLKCKHRPSELRPSCEKRWRAVEKTSLKALLRSGGLGDRSLPPPKPIMGDL